MATIEVNKAELNQIAKDLERLLPPSRGTKTIVRQAMRKAMKPLLIVPVVILVFSGFAKAEPWLLWEYWTREVIYKNNGDIDFLNSFMAWV